MKFLSITIPDYLRSKYQLIATVTFTAFFSLLSLVVISPFLHTAWFELGESQVFAFTAVFYILSLTLVSFSKSLMYFIASRYRISYLGYCLWCLAECIVICFLYAIFTIIGHTYEIIHIDSLEILPLLYRAFIVSFVAIIIPYIIAAMYFAIIDKNNTIRLINYNNVISDEPVKQDLDQKVTLFDNNGVLKMSVSLANLLYIQSYDNYIVVWYLDSKSELKRYMIRCRLKTVEESFRGSSLVRCHRQYIVNLDQVKVLRKEREGYELDLAHDNIAAISITKTYEPHVLNWFNSKNL